MAGPDRLIGHGDDVGTSVDDRHAGTLTTEVELEGRVVLAIRLGSLAGRT